MAIQTFVADTILTAAQMNALQGNDYNQTVSTKTASYTLVAADKKQYGTFFRMLESIDKNALAKEAMAILKDKNIGILITDHNALETLRLTDRAYLLFEGKILFQGTPEELAENPVVREKYLGTNFVLRRKDFQLAEKDRQGKNV